MLRARRGTWRRARGLALTLCVPAVVLVSCNAILGNSDGHYVGDGGASEASSAITDAGLAPTDSGRFCTRFPDAAFCADFDYLTSTNPVAEWQSETTSTFATYYLDDASFVSAPHSLHAVLNSAFTEDIFQCAQEDFPPGITAIDVQAHVRVPVFPTGLNGPDAGATCVLKLSQQAPSQNNICLFISAEGILYFQSDTHVSSPVAVFPLSSQASIDAWMAIEMSVQLSEDGGVFIGARDGTPTAPLNLPYPLVPSQTTTLYAGIAGTYETTNVEVEIDNVVVSTH